MGIWAVIPVKSLLDSKRRLSHLLPAQQRAELIRGLLERELSVLSLVPSIDEVLVISSDSTVWDIARQYGALVEEEPVSRGLNPAVTRGLAVAAGNGASAVLILPVDLPFITTSDVDLVIRTGRELGNWDQNLPRISDLENNKGIHDSQIPARSMTICSDEDGDGTNAIFLNPTREFSFQFGPGSFQRHIQAAQERGMTVHIVSANGLKFDLDNEKDWYTYQASMVGS